MRTINVPLTPDQLGNVITAVEHFLDYLDDWGDIDYGDDAAEVCASFQGALDALGDAAYSSLCIVEAPDADPRS